MTHPDWGTPPEGDFARYVDQLMARAAQARRQASMAPVEGFDGVAREAGAPASEPGRPPMAAGEGPASPGQARAGPLSVGAGALARGLRRWAAIPSNDGKWARWLQDRVRAATTAPRSTGAPARLYDPRVDRQPRKP